MAAFALFSPSLLAAAPRAVHIDELTAAIFAQRCAAPQLRADAAYSLGPEPTDGWCRGDCVEETARR